MVGVGTWKAMRAPLNHIRNCGKLKNHTFLNGRKATKSQLKEIR